MLLPGTLAILVDIAYSDLAISSANPIILDAFISAEDSNLYIVIIGPYLILIILPDIPKSCRIIYNFCVPFDNQNS